MNKKRPITPTLLLVLFSFVLSPNSNQATAQTIETYAFAERDSTLYLDVHKPAIQRADKASVLSVFGGGFITGKRNDSYQSALADSLVERGFTVVSIDYRLAPEFMYPCGLHDCLDGYLWLLERYAPENIVLIGESAGGAYVLTLSLLLRDRGLPLPKAVYSNSPVTQMLEEGESFKRFSLKEDFIVVEGILQNTVGIYMRPEEAGEPYVSPLCADLHGLPPIFLTASECECLLDDSRAMAKKLKEAGNEIQLKTYPKLCHAFIISPQMKPVVKLAYPDLREFLQKYLG